MKSLHDAEGARIFRFEDFTEEEDISIKPGQGMVGVPFVTFTDDDFFYREKTNETAKEITRAGKPLLSVPEIPAPAREAVKTETTDVYKDAVTAAGRVKSEAEQKAKNIIEQSLEEAEKVLLEAEKKAQEMYLAAKDDGYKEGHDKGEAEGKEEGIKQFLSESEEKYGQFFTAVHKACGDIDEKKRELLENHLDDLTELAVAVAEKVVCVSLETSGEVIKRMILSAAARAGEKQWAKVVISAADVKLMREDGIDIEGELASISDKIELIVMDDAERGACLVEFPEQAADASAATQLANIREMLRGADSE